MSEELAWAAGLMEGRGSFTSVHDRKCHRYVLKSREDNFEYAITRFADVVGCAAYRTPDNAWTLRIEKQRLDGVMEMLRPYLSVERFSDYEYAKLQAFLSHG